VGEQDLTESLPSGRAGQRTRMALRFLDCSTYRLQNWGNKARMSMKTKDKVKMSRSPDGKKPLTWLATLATLSPGRGLVTTFIGEPKRRAKYENRGNEAKKCLKTKDLTFFDAAILARFARKSTPLRPQTATSCENELRSCDLRTFRPPPANYPGSAYPTG